MPGMTGGAPAGSELLVPPPLVFEASTILRSTVGAMLSGSRRFEMPLRGTRFAQQVLTAAPGAMARKNLSGLIRLVIELGNRWIDARLCGGTHMGLAVDHSRYGLDRHTGETGYVEYCGSWHEWRGLSGVFIGNPLYWPGARPQTK